MKKKISKLIALALVSGAFTVAVACNSPSEPEKPADVYFDVTINGVESELKEGSLITKPADLPSYEENGYLYEFAGWEYTDANGETKLWNFETDTVNAIVSLTPKFTQNEIPLTVTFKNGDEVISTETVNKSSGIVSAPTAPTKETTVSTVYTFDGWYNGDVKWNFETDKVASDVTLEARFIESARQYTVTIGGVECQLAYGSKLTAPPDLPSYEENGYEYKFAGWVYTVNGEEKVWDFETDVVTSAVTITAKFIQHEIIIFVNIQYEDGSIVKKEIFKSSGLVPEPSVLTEYDDIAENKHYVFDGWYTLVNGTEKKWNFETDRATSGMTIYVKYINDRACIANFTFMNGDESVSSGMIDASVGVVQAPSVALEYDDLDENKHYVFKYWYTLVDGEEKKWDFENDKIIEDTTFYAKYENDRVCYFTIKLNGEDVNVNYGETVAKPEVNPTKEADNEYTYTFRTWTVNGQPYDFNTPVTSYIEIVPAFKKTERLYSITIDLDNGTVINRNGVSYGANLSIYVPKEIKKESSISTVYTFSHFEDDKGNTVTAINGAENYIAIYDETVRQYAITKIVDGKETVANVDYGTNLVEYLGLATKAEDADAIYTFSHWEIGGVEVGTDAIVEADASYTVVFDVTYKRYLITFDVAGKITTQKINAGDTIMQYLPTDTKRPNDEANGIIYTFSHWEDSKGNIVTNETVVNDFETYTAIYDEQEYMGTMYINDIFATKDSGRYIPVVFSKKNFSAPLTYSFEGNDISISADGKITVNNVGKTVVVTAKNEQYGFEDTFTVKTYDKVYDYVSTNFSTKYATGNNFTTRKDTHKADIAAKLDKETPSIVFMGDSFFDAGRYNAPGSYWSTFYSTFAGKNAYSFGVGGSRSEEVVDWVSDVVPYAPDAIVVHVGTNDIYDLGKSGSRTASDIVDMLATIHRALPNTKVYYFSVEYRTYSTHLNADADLVNATAKAYCDNTENVYFLDSLKYFTVDGKSSGSSIDSTKLRDSVHIKVENYYVYTDLLKEAGVDFDKYAIKEESGFKFVCGNGTIDVNDTTLTYKNLNASRTRSYLYNGNTSSFVSGDIAVWGTINIENSGSGTQFVELLLMDTTANDWFDGSKNKNAILLLSKGGARQYTPQVWGFGGTGANAAYAWNTMNTLSTEFSIVVKNKVAYITFAGVTKKMELEKDLYFGFGGENVNYTVTGLGYSTDSNVIASKIPSNAVVNTLNDVVIEDLKKANIVRSGALSAGMDAVAGEFVVEGKLDITSLTTANNPHVEFRLNGTDSNRFLLWDNEKKGLFKVSSIMAGKTVRDDATGNDLITFTAGNTLTLTWKIVVYNGDYYYYINNELRLVNKQGAAVSSINLGMQGGSCKFYDMKAYIKSNDSEGFATQIAKIQSDVTANASLSAGVHRV